MAVIQALRILLFSLLLLLVITTETNASMLTVSNLRNDSSSCVGDNLLFTCVANNTTLISWFVEPNIINRERAFQFQLYDEIGKQYNFENFSAKLVHKVQDSSDSVNANLVSTLEVTVTPELNGSRVWCSATGLENTDVFKDIFMKGPPGSPHGLNYTVLDSDLQNITLLIQWSTQSDTMIEIFIVSTNVNYTFYSVQKKTMLTLPYNEKRKVSVRAVNCAGESKSDILHLKIIGCDLPHPLQKGPIISYHSLAEGSEISYHCNTGYAPHEEMTAVCTHQGVWSHNPNELECLRDCGAPHPPLNGYVEPYNSTVEGGEVFYQCREGYSHGDVRMRAVCTADGVWNPNPATLSCRVTKNIMFQGAIHPFIFFVAVALSTLLILLIFVFSLGLVFFYWHRRYEEIKSAV